MNRSIALGLTASLLTGCQLPFFNQPPEGGYRMQARPDQLRASTLRPLAAAEASALDTLSQQAPALAKATFKLEVADFEEGDEAKLKDVVFADYLTAINHAQQAGFDNVLPSVNLVDGVTKRVNDGLYARLELILEADKKAALRRRLYDAFKRAWEGHPEDPEWQKLAARIAASLKLAGEAPDVPADLQSAFDKAMKDFQEDALRSKPLGFYTIDDALRRIFQADRMLQSRVELADPALNPSDPAVREAGLAASVMAGDVALGTAYDEVARFYERMTNPFMAYSPTALVPLKPAAAFWEALATDAGQRTAFFGAIKADAEKKTGMFLEFSLLPPSRSVETALFKVDPPPGDPMDHLIRRIREGKVSLAPLPDSGFYQYQQHALEALLKPDQNPEGTKITFGEKYLKRLEEAFKTGLTKARETHAKQLGWGPMPVSAPPPPVKPRFFVEPIVTVYQRYALMYDYLEREVLPLFPAERLAGATLLTEAGEGSRSLTEEVAAARQLMAGLYLIGAESIGLTPDESLSLDLPARQQAMEAAKAWLKDHRSDPAMSADTRVSVPVGVSEPAPGQKFIHFWGTGGVTLVKVHAEYVTLPDGLYGEPEPATYFVVADKFIAFKRPYEKGVFDRGEYRAILDGSKSWGEALRRLEQ